MKKRRLFFVLLFVFVLFFSLSLIVFAVCGKNLCNPDNDGCCRYRGWGQQFCYEDAGVVCDESDCSQEDTECKDYLPDQSVCSGFSPTCDEVACEEWEPEPAETSCGGTQEEWEQCDGQGECVPFCDLANEGEQCGPHRKCNAAGDCDSEDFCVSEEDGVECGVDQFCYDYICVDDCANLNENDPCASGRGCVSGDCEICDINTGDSCACGQGPGDPVILCNGSCSLQGVDEQVGQPCDECGGEYECGAGAGNLNCVHNLLYNQSCAHGYGQNVCTHVSGDNYDFSCNETSYLRYTEDGQEGWCNKESSCLWRVDNDPPVIREPFNYTCVDSGYMAGETYCENGDWTFRTKLVALTLLDIAKEANSREYTLFCDKPDFALNYWGYIVESSYRDAIGYINESKTNNVCVLKYKKAGSSNWDIVLGTSLNQPINASGDWPFVQVLDGVGDCGNAIENVDGKYWQCNPGDGKSWYNSFTNSVIYSKTEIFDTPPDSFELDFQDAFFTFLRNPYQIIFNYIIQGILTKPVVSSDFREHYETIDQTTAFSTIYLDTKESRKIHGIKEELGGMWGTSYLSVTYSCYGGNICGALGITGADIVQDDILCYYNSSTGTTYILGNYSRRPRLWQDLTSTLRTREGPGPDTVPLVYFSGPSVAYVDQEVQFEAGVEGCNPDFSYDIDFGDGEDESDVVEDISFEISHTFDNENDVGTRTVRLDITDDDGDVSYVEHEIEVLAADDYLECNVISGSSCDGYVLFRLSGDTNAHAQLESFSNYVYDYKVCCKFGNRVLDWTQGEEVISLSGESNAHVANRTYGTKVRISAEGFNFDCLATTGGCGDKECVVSISGEDNAHVGQCGDYDIDVCCGLGDNVPDGGLGGGTPDGCTPTTCQVLGKDCGSWSDTCGGTLNCDTCNSDETCDNGQCVCIPNCADKVCGENGCGGSCTPGCGTDETCDNGQCVSTVNPFEISTCDDLQNLKDVTSEAEDIFYLTQDIDCSSYSSGQGFEPIAYWDAILDGKGYEISNLYIDRSNTNNVGLIGNNKGVIKNIGLTNVYVKGQRYVGALAGENDLGGEILNSYSTGQVIATDMWSGGLVGMNRVKIMNSYSHCSVTGTENVGGLVGANNVYAEIINSYSTGAISGTDGVGGFVGVHMTGSCDRCYYDEETSGLSEGVGRDPESECETIGKKTSKMKQQGTFAGWDFDTIWAINGDYPYLQ